ncbi:DDT domain-containing protein PTM-like isoform X1 [Phoenix dactylifera]|uniref:DDT domain-containing protein PTM-like isoform X1 n=1 Tax=Phoenix dactylifera TaxID=42345 RepID=A0A8B7BGD4_PHODC|nr:DDT domain-containing protein PTM-like isoform X1 [Phoenix dactylifera]
MKEISIAEERADRGSEEATTRDSDALVGGYVGKDLSGPRRALLGKVASYDGGRRTYGVVYEDGHREDLDHQQVCKILIVEDGGSNMKLSRRKRKLDQLASSGPGDLMRPNTRSRKNASDVSDGADTPSASRLDSDLSEDADSSSDSCDYARARASVSSQEIRMLPLPPSSGDIAVPEEAISYLFSVYNFLRSFSVQLFLSPFGFDDFVGSLNCNAQNSLMDAIHVSLMRALRQHLQMLSSEGSELASKCLRHQDWTLLDALTWPVFLMEYLYTMRYMKGLDGKGFSTALSEREYYELPVVMKLKILQILCDDVIDSAELRTELETRENVEEDIEYGIGVSVPPESRPRRVHPRYSKTSACKSIEALEKSVEPSIQIPSSKVKAEPYSDASVAALDGNSDECRLCGMDGTLICCDGCPSAYHSRCIGLSKAFLPEGVWYCPECMIDKLGPTTSRIGRGVRGAEIFGIDMYGQMFLGTCNYLLVSGTSLDSEPFSRYYNKCDVTKVLNVICSTEENASLYADICEGILKYWEFPPSSLHGKTEPISNPLTDREPITCHFPLSKSSVNKTVNFISDAEGENCAIKKTDSNADSNASLSRNNECNEARINGFALNLVEQPNFPVKPKYDLANAEMSVKKTLDTSDKTLVPPKDEQFTSENAPLAIQKVFSVIQTKTTEQFGNGSVPTDVSYSNQPISAERSTLQDRNCASVNKNGICREDAGCSVYSTKNDSLSISYESKGSQINGEKFRTLSDRSSSNLAFFKAQGYVNQYIQGDVAASAAAGLAVLTSEESKDLEAHASSNPRKTVAANIALQIKAFSGATIQFLWPNPEKKLMEVPRERCGWCIACKGANTNKKGCLLNLAAINAIKGSARNVSGLRPIKHDDSHFPIIAAHIANMEESLRGLVVGRLSDAEYNQQWRKQLREASSCRVLKFSLLELEKCIRGIAFSGSWFKLVDDWSVELSAALAGVSRIGSNQKRGPAGRRNKRQSFASESAPLSSDDSWKDVQWWRGGKLLKVVFQKASLLSALVRKAARQGGIRRISDISYPESSEFPRRNRQSAWRASVEMSKNASQLALQVRYLDAHIRWKDLVRPEQILLDGKSSDADGAVFRNAVICDKRIVENKMIYAVTFSNQKHLPLRVTKNILEAENIQDENGKLWFSENHIPLYLIKEFEVRVGVTPSPCSTMLNSHYLLKFQKRQLETCRKDIFLYLLRKGEKPSKCSCASCKRDVLLRDSVRCSSCQGNCHTYCSISSVADKIADPGSNFTCKLCYHTKSATLNTSRKEILDNHLPSQKQNPLVAGPKIRLQIGFPPAAQSVGAAEAHPERRPLASGSNSECKAKRSGTWQSCGLIWKRKKGDESGQDFRAKNIILKSKEGMNPSKKPICCLCNRSYRSDLMYICCEKCQNWYHADALQLEEAQIFNLLGFKCNKCRRKGSPKCPYVDPDYKKPEPEPLNNGNSNKGTASDLPKIAHITTLDSLPGEEDLVAVNDDPLLYSFGRVEPIVEQTLETEIQLNGSGLLSRSQEKLSVRRPQAKHGANDGFYAPPNADPNCTTYSKSWCVGRNNVPCRAARNELPATNEANFMSVSEKESSPLIGCDFSKGSDYGDVAFDNADINYQWHDPEGGNFDGMEYEPQTYFSFTELLASEDGDDQYDMPMDAPEDGCPPGRFDEFGTAYQEASPCNLSAVHEVGSGNAYFTASEAAFDGVECQKCKLNEPSPDLTCDICGLRIHSHCSPWVESEESSGDANWRCGGCREWR